MPGWGGRGALLPSAAWYPVCGSTYGVAGQGALRGGGGGTRSILTEKEVMSKSKERGSSRL